jgi:hypothetical protein
VDDEVRELREPLQDAEVRKRKLKLTTPAPAEAAARYIVLVLCGGLGKEVREGCVCVRMTFQEILM